MSAGGSGHELRADLPWDAREPVLQVFPATIGHYADPGWADLDADAEAGRITDLLAVFGGRVYPWPVPALERGAGAAQRRLREWAETAWQHGSPVSSVLYWAGHGWSDGTDAVLAHRDTPVPAGTSGVTPKEFAYAIRARQAAIQAGGGDAGPDRQGWALVVIDACRSRHFAELVAAELLRRDPPHGVLLLGVSGPDLWGFCGDLGCRASVAMAGVPAHGSRVGRASSGGKPDGAQQMVPPFMNEREVYLRLPLNWAPQWVPVRWGPVDLR
jgi:hypothetical protein